MRNIWPVGFLLLLFQRKIWLNISSFCCKVFILSLSCPKLLEHVRVSTRAKSYDETMQDKDNIKTLQQNDEILSQIFIWKSLRTPFNTSFMLNFLNQLARITYQTWYAFWVVLIIWTNIILTKTYANWFKKFNMKEVLKGVLKRAKISEKV
jgi:hypothetical protein